MIIRILNLVATVLFGLFAYLQFNDFDAEVYVEASRTDAALWVAFYGFVSLLCLLAAFGKRSRIALVVAAICCLVALGICLPGVIKNIKGEEFVITQEQMSPDRSEVELTREFGGALIAFGAVVFLFAQTTGCCGGKKSG